MRTLADFRKNLIPGREITIMKYPRGKEPIKLKRVVKACKTRSINLLKEDGSDVWVEFPHFIECTFTENSVTINELDPVSDTYSPILAFIFTPFESNLELIMDKFNVFDTPDQ